MGTVSMTTQKDVVAKSNERRLGIADERKTQTTTTRRKNSNK